MRGVSRGPFVGSIQVVVDLTTLAIRFSTVDSNVKECEHFIGLSCLGETDSSIGIGLKAGIGKHVTAALRSSTWLQMVLVTLRVRFRRNIEAVDFSPNPCFDCGPPARTSENEARGRRRR